VYRRGQAMVIATRGWPAGAPLALHL